MDQVHSEEIMWGGRPLRIETGRLAGLANGAVLVTYGETAVLVTACVADEPRPGADFFPLTVDYEERLYSVGRIPGGFIKREGRGADRTTLACRLTDRPIRPLFPKGVRNEVQVIATVLSVDHDCPSEVPGIIGASAALTISDIPFAGPIAACVVGMKDGRYILNPTVADTADSVIDLTVAGSADAVIMIEAGAQEVPESEILGAIRFGHDAMQAVVEMQQRLAAKAGKAKMTLPLFTVPADLAEAVRQQAGDKIKVAVRNADKDARDMALSSLEAETKQALAERFPEAGDQLGDAFHALLKSEVRRAILEEGIRPDGRKSDEIRPIWCQAGVLPRTHGTGLFTRGQTQVLSVCTLGSLSDIQRLDNIGIEEEKRYMHHYNFPPFSTGEARPMRGPSRRSIGHGALAERALQPVIPDVDKFPYAIRVVSEVLSSNGSTSMGSVCGSTLSLMDAGVPISAPVAGVAMGLVKEQDRVAILTDIQGMEDDLGDMDFKVAGTAKGVTAIQMDIKIGGLADQILERALEQARQGRMFILGKMLEVLPSHRTEMSPHAPRVLIVKVPQDKIREVIGPGGKIINGIIDKTKVGNLRVEINIEDDGTIYINAVNRDAGEAAKRMILAIVKEPEVGEVYLGKVVRLMTFGAFVELTPGKDGLVHISQFSDQRINKVEDVVSVGDEIWVKVIEVDSMGRVNLSHKEALRGHPERERAPRS